MEAEVFMGKELSRDQIAEYLKKDIQGVYVLLSEILYTPEVLNAMTEVFYQRYLRMRAADEAAPKLPLDGKIDLGKAHAAAVNQAMEELRNG